MSRLRREDWCTAGLALLRDEGAQALTLEGLCNFLHRTKGSFYHHFQNMEAFLGSLLERWEEALTGTPIQLAGLGKGAAGHQQVLDAAVRTHDHRLDCALRAWALWDPRARLAMARVDRRRLADLVELHRGKGHPAPRIAAELEYAAFVGAQQLGFFAEPERAERFGSALRKALQATGSPKPVIPKRSS